ncbi:MAG: hypothetical protein KF905_05310 [Flavobacteriales bacterium]|nr:hypothetical protein [Flavobacteriales bacterium]
MRRPTIRNYVVCAAFCAALPGAWAATIPVTNTNDAGAGSLREAVALANAGDTITFDASTNGTPIVLGTGGISIAVPLTVLGNGASNTVISGGMLDRVFHITNADGVELNGLTLTMGQAEHGGALLIAGSTVSLVECMVTNSMAMINGGGIHATGGSLFLMGTTVSGNVASGAAASEGGGGIYNAMNTLMIDATSALTNNMANGASGNGGGLFTASGVVQITGATISGNAANRAGGGIEITVGDLLLADVMLSDNDVAGMAGTPNPGNGGGLHATGASTIMITGGTVTMNRAGREGGGLWNAAGTMTVDGVVVDNNVAHGPAAHDGGGGLFNNGGTLIVQNGTMITNNVADGAAGSGGGVFNEVNGVLTITGSTIMGNSAVRAGGGIEDNAGAAGSVTLVDVILNNNMTGSAPGNGGGFHITGPGVATITGGTVNGNVAALEGGGLWNGTGTMLVDGVTIDGNVANGALADQGGGGIFAIGGTVTVQNGTVISNNMANGAAGSGGGIMIDTTATLIIMNSTLHNNHANRAGGGIEIFGKPGLLHVVTDVIFTDNTTGPAPGNGGAVHITGPGDMNITGGSVTGNTATREGGGLWNGSGTMVVDAVMIDGNIASGPAADDGGGGLFNNGGTLIVQNGTMVTNNIADGAAGSGGGLFNFNGVVMVDSVYFGMNEAVRAGGGIEALNGTTTVSNSMFVGNDCSAEGVLPAFAPGNGGAVHVTGAGVFTFMTSTAENNKAGNEGGGLWGANAGVLNVVRSTVNDNLAPKGGGLFLQGGGPDTGVMLVDRSTVAANKATTGGGVQVNGGEAMLLASTIAGNSALETGGGAFLMAGMISTNSSIIADNTAPMAADFSGGFSNAMFTLVEDGTGAMGIADGVDGNLVGADPGLMPLMDNGGATRTMGLACGSVAINAGDPALMDDDQRGMPVFNMQRDMGAFELQVDCDSLCAEFSVEIETGCVAVDNGWANIVEINGAMEPYYIEWSTGSMEMGITDLMDGDYWVIVKDVNGCVTKVDFTIDCSTVGVGELEGPLGASVSLYPVPANELLNVSVTTAVDGVMDLFVTDAVGRRVMEFTSEVFAAGALRTVTMDVGALGNGSYLLTMVGRNGSTSSVRFIIAR